jgi:PPE-repeat protein
MTDTPDPAIADLQAALDYSALRLKMALQTADQARAALARFQAFQEPEAITPQPLELWHAIRQPAVLRIGLLDR